jgi:hypothetical protein
MKKFTPAIPSLRFLLHGSTGIAIAALIAAGFSAAAPAQGTHVTHAQAVARARQIVAKMTLDEKITELHGVHDATR